MFTIQSMSLYLCILKLYHARPCAHARLCMLFLIDMVHSTIVFVLPFNFVQQRSSVQGYYFNAKKSHKPTTMAPRHELTVEEIINGFPNLILPKIDHEPIFQDIQETTRLLNVNSISAPPCLVVAHMIYRRRS
jgi:hypothetical protein